MLERTSGNLGAIGSGTPRQFTFSALPAAASSATIRVRVRSDLNLASEFLTLRLDGVTTGTLFVSGANDCPATPDEATVTVPLKALAGYLADGSLTVRLEASPLVSATQCSDGLCEISISYEAAPVDCNANGIEDTCEVRIPGRDCNGNGIPDSCDIASGTSADINGNGRPDSCEYDCNANGLPDTYEIAQGLAPDCNGNSQIDSCDIAQGLALDCNGNGRPDSCDLASGTPDCNGNGRPDSCDIAAGTSADIDGNGVPDSCQGDCNGNAIPDTFEIVQAPWKDCNSNLVLDSCEIAANPSLDCTGNGRLDSCDIATANGDCNANGIPDSCEIANGAQDKDGDGLLDDCEFARGDFDLDGEVGGGDLAVVLSLWGLQNPPIGDLNGDGIVSGADLSIILSNWGTLAWQPSIASVTPASGVTSGGTTITIRGAAFTSAATVTIGGTAATSVTVVNPTTLTVVTPAGSVGARDVVVTDFGGTATAVRGFQYVQVIVPSWATLIEPLPDPAVVTNAALRNAIVATGYAWRVRDNASQIEMLLVPPGTFNMGCSASNQWGCDSRENPVHAVTLTNAFYIGRYEVTQAQWTARMGSNPSYFQSASAEVPVAQVPNRPVDQVSWNTIQDFLSSTGLRLPTEAEWEYAYRGGTTTAFHSMPGFSNGTNDDSQVVNIAWFSTNSSSQTRPVGGKAANALGLHDMSGNVWEWVNDWYSDTYYASSPPTNPLGPSTGTYRVLRGGSWFGISSNLRSSGRPNVTPEFTYLDYGFRVAKSATAPTLTSVAPNSGPASGGTTITLTGTNLTGTTSVTIGGAPASGVTVVNATTVTAVTPPGSAGTQTVAITTPNGTANLTNGFTYNSPWYTVLEQNPNPAVVTDATLRNAIIATGYAWRVRDNASQIEMLLVPPGTFDMGCSPSMDFPCWPGENPRHAVTLTNAFYIGRYEVTQAQWTAVIGSNPSFHQFSTNWVPAAQVPNRPVEQVSWNTIQGFLSATGLRLPSEAEWEYAYRAGTTTAFHSMPGFPNGTSVDTQVGNIAWFGSNSANQTRPVGLKAPNGFGLYDMSGNAWEWLNDWYAQDYYDSGPAIDPLGPVSGVNRVVRGGSYDGQSHYQRSSSRFSYPPSESGRWIGFRVARNP